MRHNIGRSRGIGGKVMIYNDPVTQQKPEGKATLVKYLKIKNDDLYYYIVRFENGEEAQRWVKLES